MRGGCFNNRSPSPSILKIWEKMCNFVTVTARPLFFVNYLFDILIVGKKEKRLQIRGYTSVTHRLHIFIKSEGLSRHPESNPVFFNVCPAGSKVWPKVYLLYISVLTSKKPRLHKHTFFPKSQVGKGKNRRQPRLRFNNCGANPHSFSVCTANT